jgi:acyl-CoA synthetase (AMP-forming)/AMP-acid ligase II
MLMDPVRWLRAIDRYRSDTSGGPNFAFDFCTQRVTPEEKAALDLSHWSVAAIGSEPVSAETMERFTAAFAPCGFKPGTFFPCYGLAEATLFVTGGPKGAVPVVRRFDGTRPVVGCGRTWPGQEVRIVDPDTRALRPDGEVGEIWLRGPSVAKGYWNRPAETEETFGVRLASGEGPYLRTGDLGILHAGELFVTGRTKDLIVIRGRNHYPQDIEATVQAAHPGLRAGCGAAFELTRDGRPCLVVVQEVDRGCRDLDAARVAGDVRQAVAERHELQLNELVLLAPGTIPKTSSGKVRRHRCRAEYETGGLRPWKGRKG